jgi:hypothetical protein
LHDDEKKSMEVAKKLEKSFSELFNIKKVMICSYWIITRIHVMAMEEQITNFTKIGIIGNLRYSSSCYSGRFSNLFLCPSPPKRRRAGPPKRRQAGKAAQPEDNCVSARFLPGTDIGDPDVDGLLDNH